MMIWLLMTAVSTVAVTPAASEPAGGFPEMDVAATRAKLNFRVVRQPELEPQHVRRSGMIVETSLAPNAALGVGLFKVSARRFGAMERADGRRQNSRKVGLNFHLHF
jgi:hypothetical protein